MRVWPFPSAPGRFARLTPGQARLVLFLLPLLAIVPLLLPPGAVASGDRAAEIIQATRAGEPFYLAVVESARSPRDAPLPALAVPPPALPLVLTHLPAWSVAALFWLLAATAFSALQVRLAALFADRQSGAAAAGALLIAMGWLVWPGRPDRPEVWAGLLVILSMAWSTEPRGEASAAAGLAAACASPVALPFLAAVLFRAQKLKAMSCAAALAAAVTIAHIEAVSRLSPLSPLLELRTTMTVPGGLWPAVALAGTWGWASRPEAPAGAVLATALACAAVWPLIDLPFSAVLAILPVGLLFVPAAAADAWRASNARFARITVRRVTR